MSAMTRTSTYAQALTAYTGVRFRALPFTIILALVMGGYGMALHVHAAEPGAMDDAGLQIEITKIGLGKEVVITEGPMEWFMRVEVTPENTVVVRQEKEGDRYLMDESETHDRSMSGIEVDSAITDFINHVKVKRQKH